MNKNLLLVLVFLLFNIGYGQKTWTGATSTDWGERSNWSPAGVPTGTQNVLITNTANQPIISDAGVSCATLTLSNSTPGSTVVVTVKAGGAFYPSSISMNSSGGNTSNCSLNIGTGGIVSVSGNVEMNALNNDVTFSGDGGLLIAGVMTGGSLNSTGIGTVNYAGSGSLAVGAYTYNNLTLSGSGIRTITTSDVVVNGILTMTGLSTVSAAPTYGSVASLKYNGTSVTAGPEWATPFIAKGGVEIMENATVNLKNGIEKRISTKVPLIIGVNASLSVTNTKLYLGGNFTNNRGYLKTDQYVYLTGNADQNIGSFTSTEGVSMIKSGGSATLTGNLNSKELIIDGLAGTLDLGEGYTHTFMDWVRIQGTLDGNSALLKISGNVTGTGSTFIPGTGTIEYNGAAQNLGTGSITYNNLVLSGSGVKTFGAVTKINENFSIVDGVKADLTANLIHTAKSIKLGTATGSGGSWGSSLSNAVNKNNTFFVSNNGIVNVGPTIVINTTSIPALATTYGTPSSTKSFDISGLAMLEGILVTAPAGFEVSTDGTTFSDALTIGGAGNIASKTVFVRLKGTIDAKDYSGDIVLSSNGTTTINIPIANSTVNKATLTITAKDSGKVYGSDNPTLTVSYVGFVNGETETVFTIPVAIATTAVKTSPAGNYPITVSGAVASNYTITYGANAVFKITPATLTITAKDNGKVYGSDNPVLTASYVGFVNGDTEANLATPATIATTAVKGSPVGNYPITVSGALSPNYTITYGANAVFKITPATLTITVKDNGKVYGSDNPVLTASYVGFVNGDTEANLATPATIVTTAVKGSPVGDYPITASGAVWPNYTITYGTNASFKITAAELIVKVLSVPKKHGDENPTFVVNYEKFVNGDTVASLVKQATISTVATKDSPVGEYAITVKDAASPNYNITFVAGILTVEPSSNADLANIVISDGALDEPFDKDLLDYKVLVPNEINTFVINPIPADPYAKAEVTVDGKIIDPTAPLDLKVGENKITIVVTAEDGTTKTSTVIVTREPSSNAGLTDLAISEGTLSPSFTEGTKDYTATVPNNTTSINVTPFVADPTAKITVEGKEVPSGKASAEIPLKVGENTITTVVTAEDGTINTYTIVVKREPSNNADLANIDISKGDLDKPVKDNDDFKVVVSNENDSFVINPIPVDPNATFVVIVDGKTIDPTAPIDLKVGDNEFKIVVTAEDGVTQKEYTVIVTREDVTPSDNAGLADIVISDGTLSPTFNTDEHEYKVEVPNATDTYVIKPLPIDPNATVEVKVDGKTIDPTAPIDLNVGENVITIVVTAEDGTTIETYTVVVDRANAEVIPTNIITPNGDGKNDYWIIPGIESYSNNSVKVFDRAARLVYSKNNYSNDWDGTYKGSPLTEDTYYYLIDLGNGSPKLKGFITIVRN